MAIQRGLRMVYHHRKIQDYLKLACSLKEHLFKAKGLIRAERFSGLLTEGKLSVWENEESVAKRRNLTEHRMCQPSVRKNDFADYQITVVTPVRTYTMSDRKEAHKYLEV